MGSNVLIVGAKSGSLGHYLKRALEHPNHGYNAITAGISGEEDLSLDITHPYTYAKALREMQYDHVIVTAGLNLGMHSFGNITDWMNEHMMVNCIGPMNLLDVWYKKNKPKSTVGHFIGVSSNSAHIARQNSMAYCASKAAFSMSLRVAAREIANADQMAMVYGYEPGLLMNTPMTKETEERFGPSATRIPGNPHGLHADDVAHQIAATLHVGGRGLNGTLVRLDGGEQ